MRVYEYAKENGSSSKEILKYLSGAGFDVANHMAVLTDDEIEFLNQNFLNKDKRSKAPQPIQAKSKPIEEDFLQKKKLFNKKIFDQRLFLRLSLSP